VSDATEELIRSHIMEEGFTLPKPKLKQEYDKFKGYREPEYLERRWEPEQL
jgi:hypothetical protein